MLPKDMIKNTSSKEEYNKEDNSQKSSINGDY